MSLTARAPRRAGGGAQLLLSLPLCVCSVHFCLFAWEAVEGASSSWTRGDGGSRGEGASRTEGASGTARFTRARSARATPCASCPAWTRLVGPEMAGPASRYMTGTTLTVDGAFSLS